MRNFSKVKFYLILSISLEFDQEEIKQDGIIETQGSNLISSRSKKKTKKKKKRSSIQEAAEIAGINEAGILADPEIVENNQKEDENPYESYRSNRNYYDSKREKEEEEKQPYYKQSIDESNDIGDYSGLYYKEKEETKNYNNMSEESGYKQRFQHLEGKLNPTLNLCLEQSHEEILGHMSNREQPVNGGLIKKPIGELIQNESMHQPIGDHLNPGHSSNRQNEIVYDPEAIDTLIEMFPTLERETGIFEF